MTMIISGDGTIGGLVAGGLPNATVVAADLASGAARANFGAGAVLQVVNASLTGQVSTVTSTRADTGLTANITPTSATSKILAFVSISGTGKNGGTGTGPYGRYWLMRNATDIVRFEGEVGYTGNTNIASTGGTSTNFLDSPATTSTITYKVQFSNEGNTGVVAFNASSSTSTITLMEIAA